MMSASVPDLKQLERNAFRLFHQDGLMDIYLGLLMIQIGLEEHFLEAYDAPVRIPVLTAGLILTMILFFAGKKWITTPRLGNVRFGSNRKSIKIKLAIILGISVLLHLGLVILTHLAGTHPEWAPFLRLGNYIFEIGIGVWLAIIFAVIGYFTENNRVLYYSVFIGTSLTASMLTDSALPFILVGTVMFAIGAVILSRFLKHYPVVKVESHER